MHGEASDAGSLQSRRQYAGSCVRVPHSSFAMQKVPAHVNRAAYLILLVVHSSQQCVCSVSDAASWMDPNLVSGQGCRLCWQQLLASRLRCVAWLGEHGVRSVFKKLRPSAGSADGSPGDLQPGIRCENAFVGVGVDHVGAWKGSSSNSLTMFSTLKGVGATRQRGGDGVRRIGKPNLR